MYKVALCKGKQTIKTYDTAYDASEDIQTIASVFPKDRQFEMVLKLKQNAFMFAMPALNPRLSCNGYKYITKEV